TQASDHAKILDLLPGGSHGSRDIVAHRSQPADGSSSKPLGSSYRRSFNGSSLSRRTQLWNLESNCGAFSRWAVNLHGEELAIEHLQALMNVDDSNARLINLAAPMFLDTHNVIDHLNCQLPLVL